LQFHCGKPPPAADPMIFKRIATSAWRREIWLARAAHNPTATGIAGG
jgi:hypothetical protein